tara:strand:+ start:1096 stop:1737 length:642 start_codon:yes stop_codon:yes gene_type:complete
MANLLDMQKILGGIQQQYPVTPPTQPSASTPTPTANPTTGKNETLAMMLYALGGALKGDEDFVVKTLQFKEMQEGKKKEKEQKEAYDEFMKKLPDGSFKDLTKALGYKKLPELLLERYKAELPKEKDVGDFKAEILAKIQKGIPLTPRDQEVLDVIQSTDPIEVAMRRSLGEMNPDIDTTVETSGAISTQEEYDALPVGAKYISNGIEYIKGE